MAHSILHHISARNVVSSGVLRPCCPVLPQVRMCKNLDNLLVILKLLLAQLYKANLVGLTGRFAFSVRRTLALTISAFVLLPCASIWHCGHSQKMVLMSHLLHLCQTMDLNTSPRTMMILVRMMTMAVNSSSMETTQTCMITESATILILPGHSS